MSYEKFIDPPEKIKKSSINKMQNLLESIANGKKPIVKKKEDKKEVFEDFLSLLEE